MSCKISSALTYSGSQLDVGLNYFGLVVCTTAVAVVLRPASKHCRRYRNYAQSSWIPLTAGLFVLQIGADCGADAEGISAVWAAQAGFLAVGWRLMPAMYRPRPARLATAAALSTALGLTVYYAMVEDAITSVAHAVAFGVGCALSRLHRRFFQIHDAGGDDHQ
ncbi:hypothetical protein JKP88DRAFT_295514, partial [Tribonema minus]